jgi:mRNA interferase MazF
MTSEQPNPKRGEVWRVDFDPTRGSEVRKTRPAVIISSDAVGVLPVRLVAPITGWKDSFERNLWHVRFGATDQNGLQKESAVDALQVRSADTSRFEEKLGRVTAAQLEQIVTAVAAVIEYE